MFNASISPSNLVSSTSPSVYVAYENLAAVTWFFRFDDMTSRGTVYNTTVAYRAEQLSVAWCPDEEGSWAGYEPVNYTALQYGQPSSYFSGCDHKSTSPLFLYPSDLTQLVPSWTTCTLPHVLEVMDPPRTLNKETAMVPVVTSSPTPAPAAHITTAIPALTSTEKPRVTQGNDPPGAAGHSSNEDPSRNNDPSTGDPPNSESSNNEPSDNHPQGQDPSNHDPPVDNSPSNDRSSTSPDDGSPGYQNSPHDDPESSKSNPPVDSSPSNSNNGNPSNHDPPNDSNDNPSNDPQDYNDPSGNSGLPHDTPTGNNNPSSQGSPKNSFDSESAPGSDPSNPQSEGDPNQNPAAGDKYTADSEQDQGLGSLIVNAFGYTPSSTLLPGNNPSLPSPSPKILQTIVNDVPSPVMVGGGPVTVATNGAVLVAGQAIDPGHEATISGAVISVDTNNVIINGIQYTQPLSPGVAPITASGIPGGVAAAKGASMTQAMRSSPVTIGTQVFTPNPSGFTVGDTAISPGGPGITIAGTAISLQPSGEGLVVGSTTLALAAFTASPELPTPITIGNGVITPNPTGFSIAGTTILPGRSGVMLDGTLVSLEPLNSNGGGLVVGNRTLGLGSLSADGVNTASSAGMGRGTTTSSGGGSSASAHETGSASRNGAECLRCQMRGVAFSMMLGLLTTFSLAFV